MRINFIGLSSFLIENDAGFKILIDPFNDAPEWSLGLKFPKEFNEKPLGANIVLMSEPDADHAYTPGDWLQKAPPTEPNSNPFPNLDLKGTIVYEWNGDLNIAYHYTIDGIRLAHFADNAQLLTQEQLIELGNPDIIFISPPKPDFSKNQKDMEIVIKNIEYLKPKLIFWTHHVVPKNLPKSTDSLILRPFFAEYFKNKAYTNKNYKDENSFMELEYILENAYTLNQKYSGIILDKTSIEINPGFLEKGKQAPISILFQSMLAE